EATAQIAEFSNPNFIVNTDQTDTGVAPTIKAIIGTSLNSFPELIGSQNVLLATGNGADTLLDASSGNNVLDAGSGNDVLNYSGTGADTLQGDAGNDTLAAFGHSQAASGNATLDGGEGADTLLADGAGSYSLAGGDGADTLQDVTNFPSLNH